MDRTAQKEKDGGNEIISIILPIRDEPNIEETLLRLHEVMSQVPDQYEIIIAMGDREQLYPNIPQLPHQQIIRTFGDALERSILAGFSFSKGEKIIVCDADGYHPYEKIPEMIKLLESNEMVAGSRYLPGGEVNLSMFRSLVSRCFVIFAHLLGSRLSDPMTGFFGVGRFTVNRVKYRPFTWKTCLEIDIKEKPTLAEIPIVPKPRVAGKSKTSMRTGLKLMRDMILG